ncbi:unnamed protein product [Boreogadus saida]
MAAMSSESDDSDRGEERASPPASPLRMERPGAAALPVSAATSLPHLGGEGGTGGKGYRIQGRAGYPRQLGERRQTEAPPVSPGGVGGSEG